MRGNVAPHSIIYNKIIELSILLYNFTFQFGISRARCRRFAFSAATVHYSGRKISPRSFAAVWPFAPANACAVR